MTVKRCVLYARISVTTEESVSVERQLLACRRYAEGRGWEIAGEFIDDGVSATANRPWDRRGWSEMMRTPDFQAVVVWKVDRLARRVLDFLTVDETLRERGVGLVAVEDPIDMTTPMGKAFATVLAVFGEMEAAAIAARVKAARAHIVAQGRWPGGGYPYGYTPIDNPDGPGKVLTKDPERIEWLERLARRAADGATINSLATWLTDQGAPLPSSSAKRRKIGDATTWNRQTVEGILRNPILAGATVRNPGRKKSSVGERGVLLDAEGDPVINPDLAIMTLAEFEDLQRALDSRATPQAKPFAERQRTSVLMSRVATCDECDVFMCRGTNQRKPILMCPKCRQSIGRDAFDAYVIRRLLTERGGEPYGTSTIREYWRTARSDDERRTILQSQVEVLRLRRGKVGAFDKGRVLLTWYPPLIADAREAA